ncbi:uncharacterized protein EV420DRAFT_1643890 [Desarmillaria tabescens]|uniref:Uncharacterized protein n=1 Tax=Armillaria tabescens TaxID=1929756 RepID=A0AA39N4W4_ARMTA|nr:uncharacterized protein EV420DRAFT_1643890 [Desarmillaria tabescens]KAK0457563.1 hypothetical protein EV420DRAFT_1643890 [Desarmillaria tabescens]
MSSHRVHYKRSLIQVDQILVMWLRDITTAEGASPGTIGRLQESRHHGLRDSLKIRTSTWRDWVRHWEACNCNMKALLAARCAECAGRWERTQGKPRYRDASDIPVTERPSFSRDMNSYFAIFHVTIDQIDRISTFSPNRRLMKMTVVTMKLEPSFIHSPSSLQSSLTTPFTYSSYAAFTFRESPPSTTSPVFQVVSKSTLREVALHLYLVETRLGLHDVDECFNIERLNCRPDFPVKFDRCWYEIIGHIENADVEQDFCVIRTWSVSRIAQVTSSRKDECISLDSGRLLSTLKGGSPSSLLGQKVT